MMKTKTNQKGFTLIELMVVMSIIGLLASIMLVTFVNARRKARDTSRIATMKQIYTALELYFNNYGFYPVANASEDAGWASLVTELQNTKILAGGTVDNYT